MEVVSKAKFLWPLGNCGHEIPPYIKGFATEQLTVLFSCKGRDKRSPHTRYIKDRFGREDIICQSATESIQEGISEARVSK